MMSNGQTEIPSWIDLPDDLMGRILQRLSIMDKLGSAQRVCRTWRRVCQNPSTWQVLDIKSPEKEGLQRASTWPYYLNLMCRHAVDRSQGLLIDFSIEYFGTDELLLYISQRCCHLRRLKLACCIEISAKVLTEVAKSFPLLEELHLIIMPSVKAADIESIGISCPMLKSFTFNQHWDGTPREGANDSALAIGKNMPNLRCLGLFANRMRNGGLEAILDGCPDLQSLDLRVCYNLDFRGDLGVRLPQRVKYVRYPRDPTNDYEWQPEIYDWSQIPRFIHKDNFIVYQGQLYTNPYSRTIMFGL